MTIAREIFDLVVDHSVRQRGRAIRSRTTVYGSLRRGVGRRGRQGGAQGPPDRCAEVTVAGSVAHLSAATSSRVSGENGTYGFEEFLR
jgi:hypothetical protein